MVPACDMANHVLAPNAGYQFVAAADAFQLRALQVRWGWPCQAGRQTDRQRDGLTSSVMLWRSRSTPPATTK
jgi:hypothetical protein